MTMNPSLVTVTIESLAFGAAGVGRLDNGKVVFVEGAYPGDTALVRIDKEKKNHSRASLVELIESSPHRRLPVCPHVDHCGGCPLMRLEYTSQLEWKRRIAGELFARIGKLKVEIKPVEPAAAEFGYRSRVRLKMGKIGGSVKLGFYRRNSHDLAPVDNCPVASDQINITLENLTRFMDEEGSTALKISEVEIEAVRGKSRITLYLKSPLNEVEAMRILDIDPSVKGVGVYVKNNFTEYADCELSYDSPSGEPIAFGSGVFTQVNSGQNLKLVEKVLKLSNLDSTKSGLDLFCGIGNFTLPLARTGAAMTGADSSARAIEYASLNRVNWKILNAHFTNDKAISAAKKLKEAGLMFDTVIIDPPRGGAFELIPDIISLAKERVVYVSCDPPSLARDAAKFSEAGFKIKSVEPVDMFPQTGSLEIVCLFKRE